jgi:UDP-N-acetylmuramyl pentapeptide phosphotransferase/UDP-N-acetylglucosamine-1-phosphate transferase
VTVARVIGVILIFVAILSFSWGAVTITRSTNLLGIGSVEPHRHVQLPIPPIVGGVALATGVVLLLAGRRRVS